MATTNSAVLKAAASKKVPASAPAAPAKAEKAPAYKKKSVTEYYNHLVEKRRKLDEEYERRGSKIDADIARYEEKHSARVNAAKLLAETGKSKDEAIGDIDAQIKALMNTRRGLRQA